MNKTKWRRIIEKYGHTADAAVAIGLDSYDSSDIVRLELSTEGEMFSTIMQKLVVELDGVGGQAEADAMIGKEISASVTISADNETDTKSISGFIIKEAEYDDETNAITLTCYDKMMKLMIPFDASRFSFPTSVLSFFIQITRVCGVSWNDTAFTNMNFTIPSCPYDQTYTYRDILDEIAQAGGCFFYFNQFIDAVDAIYPNDSGITIDPSNLKSLKIGETFGPVTTVVLARTPQEDNVSRTDTNPNKVDIRFENNLIVDSDRDSAISGLYSRLHNLTFTTFELESFGIGYMDVGDIFTLEDLDGNQYSSIWLNETFTVEQGISSSAHTDVPAAHKQKTDYATASMDEKKASRAEMKIDKNAGEIETKVSQTDYTGNVIASKINQSATTVLIEAAKILLSGGVSVQSLANGLSSGATEINGNCITTGKIESANGSVFFDLINNLLVTNRWQNGDYRIDIVDDVESASGKAIVFSNYVNGAFGAEGWYEFMRFQSDPNGLSAGIRFRFPGQDWNSTTGPACIEIKGTQYQSRPAHLSIKGTLYGTTQTYFDSDFSHLTACGTGTANSSQIHTISFGKTFPNIPKVTASYVYSSGAPSGDFGAIKIFNVTMTDFKVIIGGTSDTTDRQINWIAML